MSKDLGKYISAFDYFGKTFIVLSATSGGMSIISFTSVIGVPVGISSAIFSLTFSLTAVIIKQLLEIATSKKKKHDKIFMLAKSKLNSIVNLVSQALIGLEIAHEEHKSIINEDEKYKRLKENIRMVKSSDEEDELSEINKNFR